MGDRGETQPLTVELDDQHRAARALLERIMQAGAVQLTRGGEQLGTMTFAARVLEGHVVDFGPSAEAPDAEVPVGTPDDAGARVVVTTMRLGEAARERLRQSFGPGWVVLDLHDAPESADVVLTSAHSPQLTAKWPLLFPQAQIIVTEIVDPELDIDIEGPVGRLMQAGAHAYIPPRPLDQVAENVQTYLENRNLQALTAAGPPVRELGH